MLALTTAILTAILAIIGKILVDVRQRGQDRRGLAAALAGEIAAYIEPFQTRDVVVSMRVIAKYDRAERRSRLAGFPPLPTGHPVFDALASKVGLLPPELAKGVSGFYNKITGLRLLMGNVSSDRFLDADDAIQVGCLEEVARIVEVGLAPAQTLVDALSVEAQRSIFLIA